MKHGLVFALGIALTLIASSFARSWIAGQAARSGPTDRISCPKFIPALCIAMALFFVVVSIRGLMSDHDLNWLTIFIPGISAILLFLPLLISSEVRIADGTLSGPGTIVGPFFWFNRNTIKLSDIAVVGSKNGYAYYEDEDGRRVYVSRSYPQSSGFLEALDAMRHQLTPVS